ncbi:MAG: aldehyde ferredoxin oxidoreductase family protein [Candidatus Hodarchaeota archaeon]
MKRRKVYGYTGKILRVDLSTEAISVEPTVKYAKEWLGGRGINMSIVYSELKPWTIPYEPANRIVIGAGPLVGTLAPGATRLSIASKNVFSYGVGTANCGGHFAPELKFAGYDHIILQGRSKKPVYLWIDDDHIELRDAHGIWGKTTWETDDLIKQDIGDEEIQILCIGPAGENLVRGACIIANRNRAAGKCGLGAIMGSKNLKAVAVRGTGSVEVARPGRFIKAVDSAREKLEKSPLLQGFAKYGTHGIWPLKNEACSVPFKNFQDAHMPPEIESKMNPDMFMTTYKKRDMACMICPLHCSNFYHIDHGPYCGLATEGFQLEISAELGGKLAIEYPPAIIKGHAFCNQLGLDVDNATNPIAWAFECYQRGILAERDTDGLKLEWGDYGVIFELIRKMAYREGFGNILAEGSKHASEIVGRDSGYYAITMKGQDLYEEIRLPIGWGFGACVATRGGGHTTGAPSVEINTVGASEVAEFAKRLYGVKTINPDEYEDKAKLVIYFERHQEIVNSLGICMFVTCWQDPTQLTLRETAELYSAATGWETTVDELVRIADRILNLEKAFNVLHANLGRKDDYPPERCLKEPVKSGRYKGFVLSRQEYDKMLDEYYQLHGWDSDSGLQTRKCLENLDLANVADDLESALKIAEM